MFRKTLAVERLKVLFLASVVVVTLFVAPVAVAHPAGADAPAGPGSPLSYPYPAGGTAVVDGNFNEWDLATDFFANMYRAGNSSFDVLSKLYVRYDCAQQIVYLLVLAEPGVQVESFHNAAENWAKVNNVLKVSNLSGDDGVPPDFHYINSNGIHADGWEASFQIAPGSYTNFNVHTQVNDGSQSGQTSSVAGRSINLFLDCSLGSLGDYVWHDADGQGDQDEPLANGLAGVRVRLLNGDRTQVLAIDTTDANGYYLFTGLAAGAYVVDVNEQDVINLYGLPTLTTNNEPYPYNLAAGEHHRDADFGYWAPPGLVALGDYVWNDFNANGQQNFPAEAPENAGVRCISIFLYDSNGDYLASTNTDSWGIYMFYGLPPGTYTTVVHATDPDLEQINGVLTCGLNDGVPPRAPSAIFFTTPTSLTYDVTPAGAIELRYDYGITSTPLAVVLADFGAEQQGDRVAVFWETVSEASNTGFNLYRSNDATGPQTLLAYVPSQAPGSAQGYAYNYQDTSVQAGQTYYYWLEDVDLSGATTLHGPVSVHFTGPTAVTLSGLSAGPAAGGALPVAGMLLALLLSLAGALAVQRRRNAMTP